jgi:NAD-dependent SIR2 family protein deacetylase
MASAATNTLPKGVTQADLDSFRAHLSKSTRILALLGAGLSASSGLPTFRGAGGLWRTHDAMQLATPEAFAADPGLVWQFYSYRRHMALNAKPNAAHYALAELAKKRGRGFLTLSQNVDGTYPILQSSCYFGKGTPSMGSQRRPPRLP